jgi:hypothetical protein
VLALQGNSYTELGSFSGDDVVVSPGFSQLNLNVSQVFDLEK